MKNFIPTILLLITFQHFSIAQNVNIPDPNFKACLINAHSIDSDGNNEISVAEAEAFSGSIDCTDRCINDLTGIEAFPNIFQLACGRNNLTYLDLRNNTALTRLSCQDNNIEELIMSSNNRVRVLSCQRNQITVLPILPDAEIIFCGQNRIEFIDISAMPKLIELSSHNNQISELNVTSNHMLEELRCSHNNIESLDLRFLPELRVLRCSANKLKKLDVKELSELSVLLCDSNEIQSLDLSENTNLAALRCNNNDLKSLDISNGNNESMIAAHTYSNPDLRYIKIDPNFDPGPKEELIRPKAEVWWWIDSTSTLTPVSISSRNVYIPDSRFRSLLLKNRAINLDRNNHISTKEAEQFDGSLFCANREITDLTGIEAFTNLKGLFCYGNTIKALDLGQNQELKYLYCQDNELKRINIRGCEKLETLICHRNQITDLDLSRNPNIRRVLCLSNDLGRLNLANGNNKNLETLNAFFNPSLLCIKIDDDFTPPSRNWIKDRRVQYSSTVCATKYVHIPDPFFKSVLLRDVDINTDGDDEISFEEARSYTGRIELKILTISDLTGIEAFDNISGLDFNLTAVEKVDLSKNVHLNNLRVGLFLRELDVSENRNLESIFASRSICKKITLGEKPKLRSLYLNNLPLSNLDLGQCPVLEQLECPKNQLTHLDLSQCPNIQILDFSDNAVSNPILRDDWPIQSLLCSNNGLTELDLSNYASLERVECDGNQITSLDLSNNPNWKELICSCNDLRSLKLTVDRMDEFDPFFHLTAYSNPNLRCIEVLEGFDPRTGSNSVWRFDYTAEISTDCSTESSETPLLEDASPLYGASSEEILFYPNPAMTTIHTMGDVSDFSALEVYDASGRKVWTRTKIPSSISVSSWSPGLYFFVLRNADNVLTSKVFVEH